jgi:REP element-mobilizing transposase RayT
MPQDQPDLTQDERSAIAAALQHYNGDRYRLAGFVVMNDHVHVVVEPAKGNRLETIVQNWKSYTAHCLRRDRSRSSHVWMDEYFDRVLRNEMELAEKLKYICDNPRRRWPELNEYPWVWVSSEGE